MSTLELAQRWERLLELEWGILASVGGDKDWETSFLTYLGEKDILVRETPHHQLPGTLLDAIARQQARLSPSLNRWVRSGKRNTLYGKGGNC